MSSAGTTPPLSQPIPPLSPDEMRLCENLVTEDGKPVDNFYSDLQMALLRDALITSWKPGRDFVVMCNVGLFYSLRQPPLVPDTLLSLDVKAPEDMWAKRGRSYFIWEYGKPPDVIFEVVSNTEGEELGFKRSKYAELGISYYIVWDPHDFLKSGPLHVLALRNGAYVPLEGSMLPSIGLSLTCWKGTYGTMEAEWLRWCDAEGNLLPTGPEQAQRAEEARQQAEDARLGAEKERERADRLAAQLRAMGIDPNAGT
jgi:Uma2 family endonuclease